MVRLNTKKIVFWALLSATPLPGTEREIRLRQAEAQVPPTPPTRIVV